MEAARRMANGEPLHFECPLSEGTYHCEAESWQEETFLEVEKGPRVEQILL